MLQQIEYIYFIIIILDQIQNKVETMWKSVHSSSGVNVMSQKAWLGCSITTNE